MPHAPGPFDDLGVLGGQRVTIVDGLDHLETYTLSGLFTVLWHGPADAEAVLVTGGGAAGGLLGPDGGLFQRLGFALADHGIATLRVGYRRPNKLDLCVQDLLAAADLAGRQGGRRFVMAGHSFGGAVAIGAAARLPADLVPGVITYATQAGGAEPVELLGERKLLFIHGSADTVLPPMASEMVRVLAGSGEVVILEGADHGLAPAGDQAFERSMTFVLDALAPAGPDHQAPTGPDHQAPTGPDHQAPTGQ